MLYMFMVTQRAAACCANIFMATMREHIMSTKHTQTIVHTLDSEMFVCRVVYAQEIYIKGRRCGFTSALAFRRSKPLYQCSHMYTAFYELHKRVDSV